MSTFSSLNSFFPLNAIGTKRRHTDIILRVSSPLFIILLCFDSFTMMLSLPTFQSNNKNKNHHHRHHDVEMDDPIRTSSAAGTTTTIGFGNASDENDGPDTNNNISSSWVKQMLKHIDRDDNNNKSILQSMLVNLKKFDKKQKQPQQRQQQEEPDIESNNPNENVFEEYYPYIQKERLEEVQNIVRRLENLEEALGLSSQSSRKGPLDDDEVLTTFQEFANKALVVNVNTT